MHNYDSHNLSSNPSILQMLRCKCWLLCIVGMRSAHKTWLDCLKGKKALTRQRYFWEGNIKIDFREGVREYVLL